jgi:hypothetical protein
LFDTGRPAWFSSNRETERESLLDESSQREDYLRWKPII